MPYFHRFSPKPMTVEDSLGRCVLTRRQAEKIVNIAGLCNGDSVLVAGSADIMIEDAIKRCGARLIAARLNSWLPTNRRSADVVLCTLGQSGTPGTILALRIVRRSLRPGGRVVLWAIADHDHLAPGSGDTVREMAESAGFTSVIVGQLPSEKGREMIVATGILRN